MAATTALALGLAGALVATGVTVASAPQAVAAPGNPGVPQPPTEIFAEDWENAGDGPNVLITDYVGTQTTYTADPEWANRPWCNGLIVDFTSTQDPEDCSTADPAFETPDESFDHLQGMAYAVGEYAGDPTPETNAVTAYYTANPAPFGSDLITGQSEPLIDLTVEGEIIRFTADFGAMNCSVAPAVLEFALVAEDGTEYPIVDQSLSPNFIPCGMGEPVPVTTPDGATIDVVVGTFTSATLSVGTGGGQIPPGQYSVLMRNQESVGFGNDIVIDNIGGVDVAPQLDKAFDPTVVPVGGTSTLTFTITNNTELGAGPAFGFTDTLPAGLVVADAPNATDTCGQYYWGPVPGSSTLDVNGGELPAGFESCTFTVDVTSATAGVYVNGPDNITGLRGISAPGDATVEFTDETPEAGLTITKEASVTDAAPGDTVEYTVTVENSGQVAYTAADPATFSDDLSGVLDDATFVSADADTGTVDTDALPTLTWSGALDVGDTATITYAVQVDDPPGGDNVLVNAVVGPDEANCTADEPCTTETPIRGLVITKSADPDDALVPGQDIAYTITVENSGTYDYTEADPATFSDDMSELLDNVAYNDDASADVGTVDDSNLPVLTWSGPLAAGQTATITYTVTVGPAGSGDGVAVNRVTGPPESNCDDGTEEGCFVVIPPAGLDITKTADASVVEPGGTVTYEVTVTNTGDVPYTAGVPATFSDDLSSVLDDATYNDDASADVGTVDDSGLPVLTWSGPLAPGETATITYSVTVDDPVEGDGVLTNTVTGPPESSCAEGTETGCTVETRVRSLEITKEASPADVAPGGQVEYTVTVENTGQAPYTILNPATFDDDLTGVLDDATYDDDASADVGQVTFTDPNLTWSGPLAPGESATITYSVTVDDPVEGDHLLTNAVVGPDESTCTDGTEPGCTTTTPVRELTILKTATPDEALIPGEVIAYTITVENSGEVAYTDADPAEITDDLTEVLDDAAYNGDASADVGTVDDSGLPLITWSGPLAVDQTATLTFSVTVDDPVTGDGVAVNSVTGPPESNCVDGTEEGCSVTTPPKALTITKTADVDEVVPGGTVTYTVTVENTGEIPYTAAEPAEITDDASGVDDDATYAGDASADVGTVDDAAFPTLTWSGALDPGDVATITYSVTVDDPLTGDGVLENAVTGPVESNCHEAPAPEDQEVCATSTPVRALAVTKTADVDSAAPGDVVTYTVTVENIGQAGYGFQNWAQVTDDLSGVLDDATYNGDAAATSGATLFASPLLQWRSVLAPGESATITYSVTVDDAVTGDGMLTNSVVGPAESGCVDGTETGCTTDTPVRGLTITKSAEPDEALVPGEDITYTITVENTGAYDYTAADPATFSDDMSELLDDATYNDDASADVGTVDDSGLPTLTWSGPLPAGETATITYTMTVAPEGAGDAAAVNRVTGPPESNCVDGTEDGCFVVIPPAGLEISKTADASVVEPGQTLTYTVAVTNTGETAYTAADPATFSDDLSGVLDDATFGSASTDVGSVDLTGLPTMTWSGPLGPGESATITYSVTVDDPVEGDLALDNVVTGPAESNCVDGTGDGCTTSTPVRRLDVTKVVDVTSAAPGDAVTYTLTVANTGEAPYTIADPATVVDDLSGVLDDATVDGATADTGIVDDSALPLVTWSGALAPGESATITYSVTVDDPVEGDGVLENVVTGGSCADGTEEGCSTSTPVRSLTLLKTADPAEELVPGEDITYTITVTNTGQVPYTVDDPATITDDMTSVLDDATYNDDASADVGTVDDSGLPLITWSGPLAVGETATITYTVTTGEAGTGDGVAENTVTGPAESNCRTGIEDGCFVTIPPRSLDLTKSVDVAQAGPGDTVTYTILVANTGQVDYGPDHPAVIVDDLTDVLTGASYAGDASATTGVVDDSALPELTWSGELAAGESATITFSVTVDDPVAEETTLVNTVTGPAESNCPVDMDDDMAGAASSSTTFAVAAIGVGCSTRTVVTPTPQPSPTPTPDTDPLPRTGADIAVAVVLAVLLLVTGVFMVSVVRRLKK